MGVAKIPIGEVSKNINEIVTPTDAETKKEVEWMNQQAEQSQKMLNEYFEMAQRKQKADDIIAKRIIQEDLEAKKATTQTPIVNQETKQYTQTIKNKESGNILFITGFIIIILCMIIIFR